MLASWHCRTSGVFLFPRQNLTMLMIWAYILEHLAGLPRPSLFVFFKKNARDLLVIILGVGEFFLGSFPGVVSADVASFGSTEAQQREIGLRVDAMLNETRSYGALPISGGREASYALTMPVTAYNSLPNQTDSTPFITASGTRVRHGIVASNYFPIGTQIRIPELYGNEVFVVEDRMNPRYQKKLDIWMEDYEAARAFGLKALTIEVYN